MIFTNDVDIKSWLDLQRVVNYTINPDLTVDVNGPVDLSYLDLENLPVIFNKIQGNLYIYGNKLKTLIGIAEHYEKIFYFSNPCSINYDNINLQNAKQIYEAHCKALKLWFIDEPDKCKKYIDSLSSIHRSTYFEIASICDDMYQPEDKKEITNAYNNSINRGDDFY